MNTCPELVFGLIGAIGTDLESIQTCLVHQLQSVGYEAVVIRLSDLLRDASESDPSSTFPDRDDKNYYSLAMTAGNDFRERLGRADAVAGLAIAAIGQHREKNRLAAKPSLKRAYILHSLKRAEEIKLIRSVYGPSAFLVSAYAPRASRVERLAMQLAEREHHNRYAEHRPSAETLVFRDEDEAGDFGQDVRKAYPLSDLFVNSSHNIEARDAIERFIALIFGDPWRTPSKDEQGMAFAYLASLRSASPARQVGAALMDEFGSLLSVGTNEVAKPGGGQYWEADGKDGRDFMYDRFDLSDKMRRNLLADVLGRLNKLGILKDVFNDPSKLLDEESESYKSLRSAQLFDTIDFIRAVHAEAAALLAAKESPIDCSLLVTTFPCHECARHIVAAGVRRVVYIEPYPKSLVSELYKDSISVDQDGPDDGKVEFTPFTGVSPTVYQHLFQLTKNARKDKHGTLKVWNASRAVPCLHVFYSQFAIKAAEQEVLAQFESDMKTKGILYDTNSGAA